MIFCTAGHVDHGKTALVRALTGVDTDRLAEERRTRVVNPGVSQSELALVLGLHRSTVCRIIRILRDRGVLGHFTRCSLEILDREALAELCNPSEGGK